MSPDMAPVPPENTDEYEQKENTSSVRNKDAIETDFGKIDSFPEIKGMSVTEITMTQETFHDNGGHRTETITVIKGTAEKEGAKNNMTVTMTKKTGDYSSPESEKEPSDG